MEQLIITVARLGSTVLPQIVALQVGHWNPEATAGADRGRFLTVRIPYAWSTRSNCRVRRSVIVDAVVPTGGEGTAACITHPQERCSNADVRRLSTGTASLPTNLSFIRLDCMGTDSHMNCELYHDRLAFLPLPKYESTIPEANSEWFPWIHWAENSVSLRYGLRVLLHPGLITLEVSKNLNWIIRVWWMHNN